MHTYVIVDRGPGRDAHGDRFSVSEYAEDAGSHGSSHELLIPTYLMGYVPSRHLVEEMARRVDCYVVVDDDPDPLTVEQAAPQCECPGVHGVREFQLGAHHERECHMFNAGPM